MPLLCPTTGVECDVYNLLVTSPEADVDGEDDATRSNFELNMAAEEMYYTQRALQLCRLESCGIIALGAVISIKSIAILNSIVLQPKSSNAEGI